MQKNHSLISLYYITISLIYTSAPVQSIQFGDNGVNVFDLNVNDIFNSRFMAVELFSGNVTNFHLVRPHYLSHHPRSHELDINSALKTMAYHRLMMNTFMASNYVTKQILYEINKTGSNMIGKRIGTINNQTDEKIVKGDKKENELMQSDTVQRFLYDDGSERYKAWLERTTTFDDIQNRLRHGHNDQKSTTENRLFPQQNRRQLMSVNAETFGSDNAEDFDEGDITGYAMNDGVGQTRINYNRWPLVEATSNFQIKSPHVQAFNKNGYENNYGDYGSHLPHSSHSRVPEPLKHTIREIGLRDITDIALTTLAFLSFGMFILQVLMCITMNKDDSSNLMMMPMEATEPNEMSDGTEEIRRRRRRSTPTRNRFAMMNELSSRILTSIDAVLLSVHQSKEQNDIVYETICENNKHARNQRDGQKFWVPIWSLGISWLSSRIKAAPGASNDYTLLLRRLGGIADGLNKNVKCSFPMK